MEELLAYRRRCGKNHERELGETSIGSNHSNNGNVW